MRVDTVIIGAGTAGLSALRQIRDASDDFLVINDGDWGTTCATVGCMPSKALIEIARAYHRRQVFGEFGISGAEHLRVDLPAVLRRVRRLRDGFARGPRSVREELGSRAISGRARFVGPDRVAVGEQVITARNIIVATGSRPIVPSGWRDYGVLTSDTLFEQQDLPDRIAVIGMGALGAEIAQALAMLGIEIAGFDASHDIAGITDPVVLESFRTLLEADIKLHLGSDAQIDRAGEKLRVSADNGAFDCGSVIVAIGRRPNIDGLGLEELGVELDDRGMPPFDPNTMRIGDLPVFLAGDVNGYRPLLHEAADEGYISGRSIATDSAGYCRRTPIAITFTSPEVARVGKSFRELRDDDILIGATDFATQSRVRMAGESAGMLRIYAERESGRIAGAEMALPQGEHLAHLLALAVTRELTVMDMLAMPFYHPVLEEGVRSALRSIARNFPGERRPDLAQCPPIGHAALD